MALWRVATLLSDLAAGSMAGQPWGDAQRLGLWTVLAPVLAHSCGLAASWLDEGHGSDSNKTPIDQVLMVGAALQTCTHHQPVLPCALFAVLGIISTCAVVAGAHGPACNPAA